MNKKINYKRVAEKKINNCYDYIMNKEPDLDMDKLIALVVRGMKAENKLRRIRHHFCPQNIFNQINLMLVNYCLRKDGTGPCERSVKQKAYCWRKLFRTEEYWKQH